MSCSVLVAASDCCLAFYQKKMASTKLSNEQLVRYPSIPPLKANVRHQPHRFARRLHAIVRWHGLKRDVIGLEPDHLNRS